MSTFVIDTNQINSIRSDISSNVLPKITSCYNTVVSVKSNLPKEVTDKEYLWSSLPKLYRKIDNIYDDVVKINNLLYKAIEKMNDAEARMIKWNSIKDGAIQAGREFVSDVKDFGSDIYEGYQDTKEWFEDTWDEVYETGCEVVESVENWVENLTWEDVKDFFKTTAATIVVAFQSFTKGLITLLQMIVDLFIIVGTMAITPFTAIADGVNYLLTGESGGYTKYYWDGAMDMVADVSSLAGNCCNWLTENNPDWINENSLIEAGGKADQFIQGIGYMVGIIGITVATFGTATPAALAVTAGSLGFAKGTSEAWEKGKDAASGLLMGAINGGWEALQYYVGGKIGTSVFKGITSKIASPILKKLAVSGIRIGLDSATGAVEVPFQSLVAMADTRLDGVDGNEMSWDEAWEASGGWIGVIQQAAIAGVGSLGGELKDFGKAFKNVKVKGTTFGDALDDIYIDDLDTIKNNKENPFGKKKSSSKKPLTDQIESKASQYKVDSIDDAAIAMANYRTNKGIDTAFRFADDSQLPDINSNFWTDIKNPDKVTIDINGRQMSFDEAISYKKNYDLNMKDVDVKVNESLENITKNNDSVDIVDDGAIAMANYRANKGIFSSFSFDDASKLPDLDSNFWKNIEHPEQTFVYVDGKNMTFNDALIYRQSYESSIKHIDIGKIDNSKIISLYDRSKTILKDKVGAVNLEWFNKVKNSAYEYKLKKKYPWAYEDIKDWRSLGTITADVEKNLKEIFFDDDYVIGVHRTAMDGSANSIYNDGLILTGDLSSGAVNKNIDLENNIEFVKNKTDLNYEFFKRQVRTASIYKTFNKKGHAMIVKIPKADIDNFDKILTHNGTNYVLKSDYVIGDVSVDDLNIVSGKFKTNVNSDNINLKNVTVFENAKQILKNNEGKFSFARKKNTDIDISTIDVDDFAKKYDELTGKISSLQFKNDRSSKNQLKKLLIEKENSDKILVKLEEIFKNYVDPDHGFQCFDMTTSQHWRLGGLQHVINLNKKGYMSEDVGRYFSSIFDDGEYEIRVHKGHSMNKDNIFCDGLFNNGKKMGAMNNGIPQLDDTTVKCENIFDFVEKAKHVGSFSEGGQPTDGLFVLKIPKGLSDADVMIRNSDGRYIIDPNYIMGYMESKNGVVGAIEFNGFDEKRNYFERMNMIKDKSAFDRVNKKILKTDNIFSEADNVNYDNYGVDQGVLNKINLREQFRLQDKLIKSGFSRRDAVNILKSLNSTGACSYAAACNSIITCFNSFGEQFEKLFGYQLYKNINGQKTLNSAELLLDLYVFANSVENGGRLFENNKIIASKGIGMLDTEKQVYFSSYGKSAEILNQFLKSKKFNDVTFKNEILATYGTLPIWGHGDTMVGIHKIKKEILKILSSGHISVKAFVYPTDKNPVTFIPTRKESIPYTVTGGHAVVITDVTSDGFIISSWGKKFKILDKDLEKSRIVIETERLLRAGIE